MSQSPPCFPATRRDSIQAAQVSLPGLEAPSLEQNEARAQCSVSDKDWEPSLPRRTFDEADLTVTARSLAAAVAVLASGPDSPPSGFPDV